MAIMLNLELASRTIPKGSYEARHKPQLLIKDLHYNLVYSFPRGTAVAG